MKTVGSVHTALSFYSANTNDQAKSTCSPGLVPSEEVKQRHSDSLGQHTGQRPTSFLQFPDWIECPDSGASLGPLPKASGRSAFETQAGSIFSARGSLRKVCSLQTGNKMQQNTTQCAITKKGSQNSLTNIMLHPGSLLGREET